MHLMAMVMQATQPIERVKRGFCQNSENVEKAGYAVIQVGDLNSKPESLPYKIFTIEGD